MKRSRLLLILLLSSCLVSAQTPTPKPTPASPITQQPAQTEADRDVIKINTNLVQIDAVVTKSRKHVTDLLAEDFEIFEDGKPQAITNFAYVSNVAAARPPTGTTAPAANTNVPVPPPLVNPSPGETRRTIAIVVDDLGMSAQAVYRARSRLRKYVTEQLAENDLAAIVRTSGEIGALQQFTTDRRILLSAINHLKWKPCSRAGADVFASAGSDVSLGTESPCSMSYSGTLDALRYIITGMTALPGRKSLVVLSDNLPLDRQDEGLLPGSSPISPSSGAGPVPVTMPKIATGRVNNSSSGSVSDIRTSYEMQLKHIAELAIRGSVVIYTMDTRGIAITFPTAADTFRGTAGQIARQIGSTISSRSSMLFEDTAGAELMAKETGGFMIANSNDFDIKRAYDDQQGYYLIGFRPPEDTFDQRFHSITVRVKKPGLSVRTRKGFYGVTDDQARATLRKPPTSMNEALQSPFGANQITVRMNSLFTNAQRVGSLLRISIYVDGGDLTFTNGPDGSHDAVFDVHSVMFVDNGQVIYLRSQTGTLHLNPSQYERTLREGVVYGFDVPVKYAGAAQFRVAVRDRASGHLGTAGQVVVLPDLRKRALALSGIVLSSAGNVARAEESHAPLEVPPLRQFHQGDKAVFAYAIYKARLQTNQPRLTAQTRIYREGNIVFTGQSIPISINGQTDLQRITAGSSLQLGTEFPPGDYILQVVVTENLTSSKQNVATQWIDFEVVK